MERRSRSTSRTPEASRFQSANVGVTIRNVQKIIYSETFPQGRIWKEIANKKPIHLRAYTASTPHKNLQRISFKSRGSPKTAVVIVTKNNKKQREHSNTEQVSSVSDDLEDQELNIDKQIFKTNILRKAYGEACLKLVVRKCYKACKRTSKIACRMFKCKSSYKEKFLSSAKSACVKKFRRASKSEGSKEIDMSLTVRKAEVKNRASDATRQGFPAEECYPYMKAISESQKVKGKQNLKTNTTAANKEVHILRDRYEKACQKASSEKCESACLQALNETCETYDCGKGKKKAFKKHCRKQCKIAYKYTSKSRSSSGSSSSSSGSGSDSDSDSGSSDSDDS